jgi:hypothetical protein
MPRPGNVNIEAFPYIFSGKKAFLLPILGGLVPKREIGG